MSTWCSYQKIGLFFLLTYKFQERVSKYNNLGLIERVNCFRLMTKEWVDQLYAA